jgi:glycosyltransferase involved in cell wall biosynthesis
MAVSYKIGVILPHCRLFGGVRRFFELGELFIHMGHRMYIFTPDGAAPDWFPFSGTIEKLENLDNHSLTLLFITEPVFLSNLLNAHADIKVMYHVGPRAGLGEVLKHPDILIFSNSTNMYLYDQKKYGIQTIKAIGGVHIPEQAKEINSPQHPFAIMCYGRLSRKGKGTNIVVKAARRLYKKGFAVKLLLFDAPLDDKGRQQIKDFNPGLPFEFILDHPVQNNAELFKRADVFVAVEKKGGWSNTAAEALAAGVPLIASNTGTNDFLTHHVTGLKVWRHSFFVERAIRKLMGNIALQQKLAYNGREKMKQYSWESLAAFIIYFIDDRLKAK